MWQVPVAKMVVAAPSWQKRPVDLGSMAPLLCRRGGSGLQLSWGWEGMGQNLLQHYNMLGGWISTTTLNQGIPWVLTHKNRDDCRETHCLQRFSASWLAHWRHKGLSSSQFVQTVCGCWLSKINVIVRALRHGMIRMCESKWMLWRMSRGKVVVFVCKNFDPAHTHIIPYHPISRSMYLQVGACKNLQALVSGQREPWIEHRRGRMWGSRRSGRNLKGTHVSHGFCPGDCIISPRKTPIINYIDMEVSINGGYPQ